MLDKESVDLKVLVPSNKFRCKTSLLTAVRTKREQYYDLVLFGMNLVCKSSVIDRIQVMCIKYQPNC